MISEEVKDRIVDDYLRGDKTIVIQMVHKVAPAVMYRALHSRGVKLRRAPERSVIVDSRQLLPPGNPFRIALWNLTLETWELDMDTAFKKLGEVLTEYLEKEPYATVEALGYREKSFSPEDLLQGSLEMVIEFTFACSSGFERLDDGSWKIAGKEVKKDAQD